jgi:hypothetical protein
MTSPSDPTTPKVPKPLGWVFNAALAGAFFFTVFVPFWLLHIPAEYSAWGAKFAKLYPYSAYRLMTALRLWKVLPLPRAKDAGWLLAFACYAVLSLLFAALCTAVVGWRRRAAR